MDGQLRDVVRLLQSGPYVSDTVDRVRQVVDGLRRAGRATEVEEQRADFVVMLDDFAEQARTPADAAAAHLLAADLCQMGGAHEHGVERLALALDLDPANEEAARLLERVLSAPKDRPRLLALLSARAQALVTSDYVDDSVAAGALVQIGAIHAGARDWDKAIDVYDRALELSPDVQVVETLASLYERRRRAGDAEQAADLLCALYDVLPPDEGLRHVQHALRLVPGHAEARQRLQAARPVGNHGETKVGPAPKPHDTSPPLPAPPPMLGTSVPAPAAAPAVSPRQAITARPPAMGRPVSTARPAPLPNTPVSVPARPSFGPASMPSASIPSASIPSPSRRPRAKTMDMQPSMVAQSLAMAGAVPGGSGSSAPPRAESSVALNSGDMFSVVSSSLTSGRPAPSSDAPFALEQAAVDKRKKLMAAFVAAATLLVGVGAYAALSPSTPESDDPSSVAAADAQTEPETPRPELPSMLAATVAAGAESDNAANAAVVAPPTVAAAEAERETPTVAAEQPQNAAVAAMEPAEPSEPSAPEPRARARKRRPSADVRLLSGGTRIRGAKVSKAKFLAALDKRVPNVERCYTSALRRNSKLEGRMVYTFKVKRNGRPYGLRRSAGTLTDKRLERCTTKALAGARFPQWKKSSVARVRMPLRFEAKAD